MKTNNAKALQDAVAGIYKDLNAYAKQEKLDEVATAAKATQKALEEAIAAQKTKDEAAQKAAQQKLDEAVKALETKIATAQKAGDDANKAAASNASEIETLAKTVKTAGENLTKVQENLTKVEDAVKTLGAGFDEKNTVEAAIKAINGQLTAKNTGLAGLDERLSAVEAALKGDENGDKLPNLKLQVDNIEKNLKDIIGQYSTMVTDVQLFDFAPGSAATGFDEKLNFIQATEQANVFPGAGVADAQFTFEKGKYFAGEDSLLIRVSPVDAELTTSNISLLNSQGKELNDLIEVTGAHRYDKLLHTRAAGGVNTGLWVVKFKAKDLGDDFKAAAKVKVGNADKSILYSVAVKNTYTTDEAKDRRVTSEYSVTLGSDVAKHAYDFKVNDTSIKDIKNRTAMYTDVDELDWKDNSKPATTVITTGNDANAGKNATTADNRNRGAKILAVEEGGDIVIDFTKQIGLSGSEQNKDFGVKGFYVTLDEKFAKESGVSEINAWRSYTYENVGYKKNGTTTVPAHLFTGNQGTIRIQKLGNAKGDVIGFRVYAVNYDGTLTDPDGRAFYVAVGDAKADMTIPATTVSIDMATANSNQPEFVSPKVNVDLSKCNDFDSNTTWVVTAKDKSGVIASGFSVKYFKADGSETPTLSKDVKAVQFVLDYPQNFVDGETYTVATTLEKNIAGTTAEVGTVTASFKKEMPTAAPEFGYRDGFDKFEYIIPTGDNYEVNAPVNGKIPNKNGKFDFRNILIINNNSNWNGFDLFEEGLFNFNVANGTYKAEDSKYVLTNAEATITATEKYILNVNNGGANLVDNETERTIAADFVYKNISKQYVKHSDGTMHWETVPYKQASPSSEKIVYCSWMKTFNVATNGGYYWTGKAEVKDKNGRVTEAAIPAGNVVTWSTNEHDTELHLSNVTAKVADLQVIPKPAVDGVKGNNLAAFFASGVITLVEGTYGEVWTTSSDGKQINPYFSATYANGKITLTQNSQTAIPSNVKGGWIHFTVRDCFGNLKAIKLPFVIKMPAVTARKH